MVSLSGGSADYTTTLNFSQSNESIDIVTSPSPCLIGTTGSNLNTSCHVAITAPASTTDGNYTINVTATSGGSTTSLNPITVVVSGTLPSDAKSITSYSLNLGTTTAHGSISGTNIAVTVPNGTNVESLVASFTSTGQQVTVESTPQISGQTPNNFTNPVNYIVTAADNTSTTYRVTVTVAPADAKAITEYWLDLPNSSVKVQGVITGNLIAVTMPNGTNLSSLVATFVDTGISVQVGGVTQNSGHTFNNFTAPVVYTVTAADGTTNTYTVTVTDAASDAKAITAFSLYSPSSENVTQGVINGSDITVTVVPGNVTNLIASFNTTGVSITVNNVVQTSGITPNDFSSTVVYTVTAADGTTASYNVNVVIAPTYAYALSNGFSFNKCKVNNNGLIESSTCGVASSGALIPDDNNFYSNAVFIESYMYVVTESSGRASYWLNRCLVAESDGSISNCNIVESVPTNSLYLAINNSYLYMTSYNTNSILKCQLTNAGSSVSGCISSSLPYNQSGITFNANHAYTYGGEGDNPVVLCNVAESDGSLSECHVSLSIAFNTLAFLNSYAYAADLAAQPIRYTVNSSGELTSPSTLSAPQLFTSFGFVFSGNYVYTSNDNNGAITACTIGNGNFSNCTVMFPGQNSGGFFSYGSLVIHSIL